MLTPGSHPKAERTRWDAEFMPNPAACPPRMRPGRGTDIDVNSFNEVAGKIRENSENLKSTNLRGSFHAFGRETLWFKDRLYLSQQVSNVVEYFDGAQGLR